MITILRILFLLGFGLLLLHKFINILTILKKRNMMNHVLDVKEFLILNRDDLISIYKERFKNQVEKCMSYTGFKKQMFKEHLEVSIKQDIREKIASRFNLNAEQTLYIENDETVNPIIITIIEGSIV